MVIFEKYENERGSLKRLNVKAKYVQGQLTKLEKEYEEINEVVSDLMIAIIIKTSERHTFYNPLRCHFFNML